MPERNEDRWARKARRAVRTPENANIQRLTPLEEDTSDSLLQPQSPQRRRLLILGALGLISAATGLSILAYCTGNPNPTEKVHPTLARLRELDGRIQYSPSLFPNIAPEIGEMAISFFCQQLGYSREDFRGRFFYELDFEYLKVKSEQSSCTIDTDPLTQVARTSLHSDDSHFNLTKFLASSTYHSGGPATLLFILGIHEAHHNQAPVINLNVPEEVGNLEGKIYSITRKRGFGMHAPNLQQSKPGRTCHFIGGIPLEEGAVEGSTKTMVEIIGYTYTPAPDYQKYIDIFHKSIVDRFFEGDQRAVMALHQRTDQDSFFRRIGSQLKQSNPFYREAEEKAAGMDYVSKLPW